jgi:hypothetical protein
MKKYAKLNKDGRVTDIYTEKPSGIETVEIPDSVNGGDRLIDGKWVHDPVPFDPNAPLPPPPPPFTEPT